jgi:hypothetical protein
VSTPHIWTPGATGPLDELVATVSRMVTAFGAEHDLEDVEVRIELVDGSRFVLVSASPQPGFGFLSFVPHRAPGEEPRQLIAPIGAVKTIEISAPDPERPLGFATAVEP